MKVKKNIGDFTKCSLQLLIIHYFHNKCPKHCEHFSIIFDNIINF